LISPRKLIYIYIYI